MEFRLLGEVQAWHDGRPVDLGGRRQRCVLAVLLLHPGQLVPVDRIVAQAWPADPPDTAADLVTAYVSKLRKRLECAGEEVRLISRQPGYLAMLNPQRVDAHRFIRLVREARVDREALEPERAASRLREALDLWQGIPMTDLDSTWLRESSVSLEHSRLDAVEDLAELELDARHPERVVVQLRELARTHPERERLAVLASRALRETGEPAQAVQLTTHAINALRETGLDPSPALRQAQTEALNHDTSPAPLRPKSLHTQLPVTTRMFTGRTRELADLIALADPEGDHSTGTVVISAIDGMAGIGKTALAVHAAHQLAKHYPDGQLFIDLHGFTLDMDPTTPDVALDKFLRALGVSPQQIPQDLEDRAALYRERLAATRTLIILDNAATEAQIRPLLPGAPGCLVLITSRRKLAGLDDAQAIRLDVLPDADATALFTAVAGPGRAPASDPAVTETIELCGHMPLAIRIAAARLRSRPAWRPHSLVARLRDQSNRLAQLDDGERSLTAALALSYNHLTGQEKQMFRYLGLHPGTDIDTYAAAALADTSFEETDRLLERLVDHNLLAQPSSGRYQLHDLVRIYARTLAVAESGKDNLPLARLVNYYLHTAHYADKLVDRRAVSHTSHISTQRPAAVPSLIGNKEATAWMEAERANLGAMANYAAHHGPVATAIALPAAMHNFLLTQGHWVQDLHLQRTAMATAERIGDRRGQANALCSLGDLQAVLGQYTQAEETLGRALELHSDMGDRLGQANAYSSLAHVYRLTAHFAQAMEPLRHALELYSSLENWLGQANALITLGAVQKQTGQYSEAEETLHQALGLCARAGHRLGRAEALTDLGEVQQMAGQYPKAADTLREALEECRGLGNRNGQATALTNLGEVYLLTGQNLEADEVLRCALRLYRELGNRLGEANALTTLGAVQHALEQQLEAAVTLGKALQLYRQLGNRLGQAYALTALTEVQHALGHHEEATELHRQALELYLDVDRDL